MREKQSGASTRKQKENKRSGRRWRNLDFIEPEKRNECGEDKDAPHLPMASCHTLSPGPGTPRCCASSAHCSLATCHLPPPRPRHQPRQSVGMCWWHLSGHSSDTSGFAPHTLVLNALCPAAPPAGGATCGPRAPRSGPPSQGNSGTRARALNPPLIHCGGAVVVKLGRHQAEVPHPPTLPAPHSQTLRPRCFLTVSMHLKKECAAKRVKCIG